MYVPGTVLKSLHLLIICSSQQQNGTGTILPALRMRTLRHRKVNYLLKDPELVGCNVSITPGYLASALTILLCSLSALVYCSLYLFL